MAARLLGVVGAATLVVAAVAGMPCRGEAQATPNILSVIPSHGAPGTTWRVEVQCPTQPYVQKVREYDDVADLLAMSPDGPGRWAATGTFADGGRSSDVHLNTSCGPGAEGEGWIDADVPTMFFGPYYGWFGTEDPPTQVLGKDCPPGSTAIVGVRVGGEHRREHQVAIGERGDWGLDLPEATGEAGVVVDATCGAVVFDTITHGDPAPPAGLTVRPGPSTSTTTAPHAHAAAAGAVPVPGSAVFTG